LRKKKKSKNVGTGFVPVRIVTGVAVRFIAHKIMASFKEA